MALDKCSKCGELMLTSYHQCNPGFWCMISPDDPQAELCSGEQVFAYDAQEAAEKYVQRLEEAYSSDGGIGIAAGSETIDIRVYKYQDWKDLKTREEELGYQEDLTPEDDEEEEAIALEIQKAQEKVADLKFKYSTWTVSGEFVPSYYAEEAV